MSGALPWGVGIWIWQCRGHWTLTTEEVQSGICCPIEDNQREELPAAEEERGFEVDKEHLEEELEGFAVPAGERVLKRIILEKRLEISDIL